MTLLIRIFRLLMVVILLSGLTTCKKIKEITDINPEIDPLKQGFKTSAAIGYCASLAATVLSGEEVPPNVVFEASKNSDYSKSGIMYVTVNESYPLPFNNHIGDMVIAGLWDGDAGVMSVVFADLDLFSGTFEFYGVHTVPFFRDNETGNIITVFAQQDIIFGEGSDTILDLNMSKPKFNMEAERTSEPQPEDVFVAAKQNVWFVNINQQNTPGNIYDDSFRINGGGQIAEATSESGGIVYHAMIETKFVPDGCLLNPSSGVAFMQNLKAGSDLDLGDIYLDFHDKCDGKAYVEVSSGEYLKYLRRNVNLHFTD
jgi:hypothetical protein